MQLAVTDRSRIITNYMNKYRFSDAANTIYKFTWHVFADKYIEQSKKELEAGNIQTLAILIDNFNIILKLLHPFMPFVTEELWGKMLHKEQTPLITSSWPWEQS
jgi:valyl-tRNA synthetase